MADSEKVLAIKLRGGSGPIITNAEQADFMGAACIKGRGVGPRAGFWAEGRIVYVMITQIESVVVFDTIDEYRQAMLRHEEGKKSAPPSP